MPQALSSKAKRTRASRPKVRTGCGTCKIRHKKCDETRPCCVMCSSTGRICDGYQHGPDRRTRAFRMSKTATTRDSSLLREIKYSTVLSEGSHDGDGDGDDDEQDRGEDTNPFTIEATATPTAATSLARGSSRSRSTSPSSSPRSNASMLRSSLLLLVDPHKASMTQRERWYFDFFLHNTSSQCAIFYGDEFWLRVLPQFAESEPELRHAVIAVAALHRNFEEKRNNNKADNNDDHSRLPDSQFPIEQCNRAITRLQRRLESGEPRPHMQTLLTTCILFVSFAFFSGDTKMACSLLKGGFQLMNEWEERPTSSQTDPTIKLALMKALSRMQIHSLTCGLTGFFVSIENPLPCNYNFSGPIENLEQLSDMLFEICRVVLQCVCLPPTAEDGYNIVNILDTLQELEAKYCASLKGQWSSLSLKEQGTLAMLGMWREIIYVIAAAGGMADGLESRYDVFIAHFRQIIKYAKKLLSNESYRSVLPTFHMGPGIIPPLFLCAYKCRDWDLRQDTISLMQSWQCQEGFWSTPRSVKCLKHIVQIETEGLSPGEVVPETRRIAAGRFEIVDNDYRFWYRLSRNDGKHDWQSVVISG